MLGQKFRSSHFSAPAEFLPRRDLYLCPVSLMQCRPPKPKAAPTQGLLNATDGKGTSTVQACCLIVPLL